MKDKKNIILTGVSSHLGQALLKEITTKYNYKIITTSRSLDDLTFNIDSSRHLHLNGIDLTKGTCLSKLKKAASSFLKDKFDIIHSVGNFWYHVPFSDYPIEQAKVMMESHYLTLYGVCYEMLPLLIENGGGHIIAFSCNSVRYNYPNMAAFTSAKAAVETLIKCLANEYSKYNIVANVMALASLQTDTVKKSKPYGDFDNFMSLKKVAKTVLEINNEEVNYLNGNVINLFKYSDSFYNVGYLERNRLK